MTGFAGDPLVLCEDIDECHDRTDGCSDNAYCVDTDGTYECECYEGVDYLFFNSGFCIQVLDLISMGQLFKRI